jgi:hypothetical protein
MVQYESVTSDPYSLLTYSWISALLEEPPILQPLKNFPAFYGTRKFNTVFTRALHWSLSWAILFTHLRLGHRSGLFPSGFPTNFLYSFFFIPIFLHDTNITWYKQHPSSARSRSRSIGITEFIVVQWLCLAFSKGLNWVGVVSPLHPRTETSSFQNVMFLPPRTSDDGKSPNTQ